MTIGFEIKQMWFASDKEVRLMVEVQSLLLIIYILFYALIATTIMALSSLITIALLIFKKSKNQ